MDGKKNGGGDKTPKRFVSAESVRWPIRGWMNKHISKLRVLYFGIVIFIILGFLYFLYISSEMNAFINQFITSKNEGTLSDDNAFTNTLITELRDLINEDKAECDKWSYLEKQAAELLKGVREPLEKAPAFHYSLSQSTGGDTVNLEHISYHRLDGYLHESWARKLDISELGLGVQKVFMNGVFRSVMQTENPESTSFVFIPSNQIDIGSQSPSWNTKREIIFSKKAVELLADALKKGKTEVGQVYYISLNGFIRICKVTQNSGRLSQRDYYRNKFNLSHSFADRPYFSETLKDIINNDVHHDGFRISEPYVDIAGLGIVRTYTIPVINKKLDIIGLIGFDVHIKSIRELLENVKLGPALFPRKFTITYSEELDKKGKSPITTMKPHLRPGDISEIQKEFNKDREKFTATVQRFEVGEPPNREDRIIYTLPFEENRVAFIIFDKGEFKKFSIILFIMTFALFGVASFGILWVSKKHVKNLRNQIRDKEKQFQWITRMHGAYVIIGAGHCILEYNDEFEKLVDDKDLEAKKLTDFLTDDSARDFEFYINSSRDRFENTLDVKSKSGMVKPVIIINNRVDEPNAGETWISILIESGNFESSVAEKYIERISHLMKTPLHTIIQIAGLMRKKSSLPRLNEYYVLLEAEISSLRQQISKLLNITAIEIKKMQPKFEKINLSRMTALICREFEPLAKKKKLDLKSNIADGAMVWADNTMIKTSIENILENAVKYTREGGVSLFLRQTRDSVLVEIKDSGIGIPDHEKDDIFKKRFRGSHPFIKENAGQGIGLFQTKQFILLNKGNIELKSTPEVGSAFTISLPKNDGIPQP